jgi:inorganic pyrophosphatase
MDSKSLEIAKKYLGKEVKVKIDRPLGSTHPRFDKLVYTSNYGEVDGVIAPDGDFLDAYVLKVDKPLKEYTGSVIAIVHRLTDDDDKLVVVPTGETMTDEEIEKAVEFQEKWSGSEHVIVR